MQRIGFQSKAPVNGHLEGEPCYKTVGIGVQVEGRQPTGESVIEIEGSGDGEVTGEIGASDETEGDPLSPGKRRADKRYESEVQQQA